MPRPSAQPGPRYGHHPNRPAQRRSGCGRGLRIIGGLTGGVLLFIVLLVLVSTIGGRMAPSTDDESADTAATGTTESDPGSASRTTTSTTPTDSESQRSTTPKPDDVEQGDKVRTLADHPILQDPGAELPAQECDLPAWQPEPSAIEEFFLTARDCLDAVWGPFLTDHDLPFEPPTVHFPDGSSFDTACGTIEVGLTSAAYYCQDHLYMPFEGMQTERYGDQAGVYLALFAHEYGHHVQEVAGIMDATWENIYQEGEDSPAGAEMSRRMELQAQCFSGVFFGAHTGPNDRIPHEMYEQAWRDQENRGDDTSGAESHGSNANYAAWWKAGTHNRIAECNTFTANSDQVS